jgi:dihydropteroate synthase
LRLNCGGKSLDLSHPRVMGVLNVTSDSFSDGGKYLVSDLAIERALAMQMDGAAIIDVGGESTRPGAQPVSAQQEIDRVLPVIETLARELSVPMSIDTSKPEVMAAAARAGAGMINDVRGLSAPGSLQVAAASGLPVCLMHMQGEPRTMQVKPQYREVVADIRDYLEGRIAACERVGIASARVLIDPGFGFGKTLEQNLELLAGLRRLAEIGRPLVVGISRKSMLGAITGRAVDERLAASLAAAVLAVERGAVIVRAHDVVQTVDVLAVADAIRKGPSVGF